MAFATINYQLRTSASAITALARSLGGSIGISIVTTLLARNIQTSHSDLASQVTPESMPVLDPSVIGMLGGGRGDMAIAMVDSEVNRQAAMIAYLLLRIAARLHRVTLPTLRFAELVGQRLFLRRPIAEIDKPPPYNLSQSQSRHCPNQLEFCYA